MAGRLGPCVEETGECRKAVSPRPRVPVVREAVPAAETTSFAEKMAFLEHVVNDEDYYTGIRIQTAMKTGAKSEVLFGRNEGGGQRFHRWVEAIIGAGTEDELAAVLRDGIDATA